MIYEKERKRICCIIPPYYRLIESKNNRLTPAMHYVAECLYRRGHEVLYVNGDYGDDSLDYSDRISMKENSWLFEERYKNGHESYDQLLQVVKEFNPDIVFISAGDVLLPTVEIASTQSCGIVARMIKEKIGKEVICVGYGHLLKYAKDEDKKYLDYTMVTEGEVQAINIVEGREQFAGDAEWCTNMDELPILTDRYIYNKPKAEDWDYIMSMRGCPNRCTFCFQPSMRGCNVSMMSPERFVREIRYRIENYGTKGFYFSDMIFLPYSGQRTNEMLDRLLQLKKEFPDFNWWAESRVDTMADKACLEKMKASGCRHLKFGVEMANQEMLNVVKKGINLAEIKRIFKLTKECGIERTAYVLLGCPGFEDNDYREMCSFFKEIEAENYVININVPYIGTQLYEQVKDKLREFGIMTGGEESYIHTSTKIQEFWGISDETVNMFFALQGKKDDSNVRRYKSKIVNKKKYIEEGKVEYIKSSGIE